MRLLFFGDADSLHLQRWVGEMAGRGFECHVATRRPGAVPGAAGVSTIRPGNDAAGWFAAVPQVRALTRRLSPDWVHGHYITSNGLWAAASGHPRVALTAWGSDILVTPQRSRAARALTGWTLRRAALVTADSADTLAEIGRYRPQAALHEISWGADTGLFTPPPRRAEVPGPVEIVSLRNWEPNYNIGVLLQACARLRQDHPALAWRLHLLGGGPLASSLKAEAAALGLNDEQVRFHGRLDEPRMVELLQRCSIAVTVPSSDATSVSMLEAMACGLAVVASELPANAAWIDGEGGLRVPPGDAAALATALATLIALPPSRLAALGDHNREQVVARASRRREMDRMAALYRGLVLHRPQATGSPVVVAPEEEVLRVRAAAEAARGASWAASGLGSSLPMAPLSGDGIPSAQDTLPRARTVSVIVPCRNEAAHIGPFCGSVLSQRLPPGWRLEVLVADGLSDDGTREQLQALAARDARFVVIDNPGRIVSPGLNAAIARSSGEVIVRLDVHSTYSDDYIAECLAALRATGADNVGGPWRAEAAPDAGALQHAIVAAFQSRWLAGGARSRQLDHSGWVDTVYLGAWPRATFERHGGFDETLVRNQDDEHNLRLVRGGGKIWQSAAIRSSYRPRARLAALFRQHLQYGYWKPFVMRKHGQAAAWRHLVPGAFVLAVLLSVLACAVGGPAWPALLLLGAYAGMALVASLAIAARRGWPLLLRLPGVIAATHWGYGAGSLLGWINIARGAGKAQAWFTRLTR